MPSRRPTDPPGPPPLSVDAARPFERWVRSRQVDPQDLQVDYNNPTRSEWISHAVAVMSCADEAEVVAALARKLIHRACWVLDEREVQAAVRAALVPWALGYSDPLRA